MHHDLSTAFFEKVAHRTVETMPEVFRKAAQEVAIRVVNWPSEEMLKEVGLNDRHELTGLYAGVPVTHKSVWDQPTQPDVVWLFRKPIIAEWHDRGDVTLAELIAHVTVHEFAHHFGWSDDDIAAIDRWWE